MYIKHLGYTYPAPSVQFSPVPCPQHNSLLTFCHLLFLKRPLIHVTTVNDKIGHGFEREQGE